MSAQPQPSPQHPPTPLAVIADNIPDELKLYNQWVCWRYTLAKGRWTKIPFCPSGSRASATNPDHYSSFEDVFTAYTKGHYSGVGFALTTDDPFVALDIDHCLTGSVITEEAGGIIKLMNSYSEISPSGTGIRILAKGIIPKNVKKEIEMYISGRYITLTGHRWQP